MTRRRRKPRGRAAALRLDPYLAYLVFAAVGVGTYRLGQDGRLVLLWLVLLGASLIYADHQPIEFQYALTRVGQGTAVGLVLGVPLAILAAGLSWYLYRSLLRWRAGKPRRSALRQLVVLKAAYQESGDTPLLGIELSELLRRAMLAYAPRDEVAGLTGERWLQWLDQGMSENVFSEGPGKVLESLPYRNPDLGDQDVDVDGLISAVRMRLQTPVTGSAV